MNLISPRNQEIRLPTLSGRVMGPTGTVLLGLTAEYGGLNLHLMGVAWAANSASLIWNAPSRGSLWRDVVMFKTRLSLHHSPATTDSSLLYGLKLASSLGNGHLACPWIYRGGSLSYISLVSPDAAPSLPFHANTTDANIIGGQDVYMICPRVISPRTPFASMN
jgi:hypothetical protein